MFHNFIKTEKEVKVLPIASLSLRKEEEFEKAESETDTFNVQVTMRR